MYHDKTITLFQRLIVCLLVAFTLVPAAQAQRDKYSEAFQKFYTATANSSNGLYTASHNRNAGFVWGRDYRMQAYVKMARAEENAYWQFKYMTEAVAYMEWALANRDDRDITRTGVEEWRFPGYNTACSTNVTTTHNYPACNEDLHQRIEAWWTSNRYNHCGDEAFADAGHSGLITYPMGDFAQWVLTTPSVQNYIYTRPAPPSPLGPELASFSYDGMTFLAIANDLIDQVNETIQAHHSYHWQGYTEGGIDKGSFEYDTNVWGNPIRKKGDTDDNCVYTPNREGYGPRPPHNLHAAMGRSVIMVLQAYEAQYAINPTPATLAQITWYTDLAEKMANHLHPFMTGETEVEDGYWWWYQDKAQTDVTFKFAPGGGCTTMETTPSTMSNSPEDLSHAAATFDYAYLANKYEIGGAGTPIYTEIDMDKIALGMERVYLTPLNYLWNVKSVNNRKLVGHELTQATQMVQSSKWRPQLYHNLADALDPYILYNDEVTGQNAYSGLSATNLLGIARLALHGKENNLNMRPEALSRDAGNGSEWTGVSGGDFNGDGIEEEYITVRNFDQTFYLYRREADFNNVQLPSPKYNLLLEDDFRHSVQGGKWNDVAAGNIDPSDAADEFVAVRNYNGYEHFFVFDVQTNGSGMTITAPIASYTGWGNASAWAGITVGDFDPNQPGEEIVSVRNNANGEMVLFRYDGTSNLSGANIHTNIYNWTDLSSGDIDNDGVDEIIGVTASGKIYMIDVTNGSLDTPVLLKNTEGSLLSVTVGDFDRNQIDNEVIVYDEEAVLTTIAPVRSRGALIVLQYDNSSGNLNEIHTEALDNTWAIRDLPLGTVHLEKKNCDYDKLIVLRNSATDGHHFIFNVGLETDNSWSCSCDVDPSGKRHLDGDKIVKSEQWVQEDHYVDGVLTLKAGAQVTAALSDIKLFDEATIVVEPGAELKLEGVPMSKCNGTGSWKEASPSEADPAGPPVTLSDCVVRNSGGVITVTCNTTKTLQHAANTAPAWQQIVDFKLSPNPSNGQTTARIIAADDTPLQLSVYNQLGQRMAINVQANNTRNAIHELTFSVAELPAGLYHVRVQAGMEVQTKRLVVH